MSSNTIGPLSKKSDNPSKRVRKSSGDLDDMKKALVTNIDTVVKEVTTDMVDKKVEQNLMWRRNPSLLLFQQKRRFIHSTKQRNHKHQIKQLIHTKAIKLTKLNQ